MAPGVAIGIAGGTGADRLFGDPARGHPVAAFGRAASWLEGRMFRPTRGAGAAYTLALAGGTAAAFALLDRLLPGTTTRAAVTGALCWACLGGRSLERRAIEIAAALESGDLPEARRLLPALAGRDPCGLGESEICRAAVESVAENTADAVAGPLLWCAVAGPGGAALYRAANTLDAMVGYKTPRYRMFGWASARLDDALTWPAARLAALLTVVLAPLAGADRSGAWRMLRRDGRSHPSPNAGLLEAAFAGGLGLSLGGTNHYGDVAEHRPLLGDGPPPGPGSIRQAVRLSRWVGLAAAAVCTLLARRLHR